MYFQKTKKHYKTDCHKVLCRFTFWLDKTNSNKFHICCIRYIFYYHQGIKKQPQHRLKVSMKYK